jgi:hypothetical protein
MADELSKDDSETCNASGAVDSLFQGHKDQQVMKQVMDESLHDLLGRFAGGDITAIEPLRSTNWSQVVQSMRTFSGKILRDGAKRVLLSSRDPRTATAAQNWASFVREGSFDPWVLEDGVLVSRPLPGRRGEVEFALEPGFEDTILDVVHRIDDINIDGPIPDDEFGVLLQSVS